MLHYPISIELALPSLRNLITGLWSCYWQFTWKEKLSPLIWSWIVFISEMSISLGKNEGLIAWVESIGQRTDQKPCSCVDVKMFYITEQDVQRQWINPLCSKVRNKENFQTKRQIWDVKKNGAEGTKMLALLAEICRDAFKLQSDRMRKVPKLFIYRSDKDISLYNYLTADLTSNLSSFF